MISIYSVEYAANLGSDCGTYSAQKQTYTSSTHNSRGNAFIYSEGTGRITVYPTDSTVKSFSWGETYASDTIAKEYGGSIQTYAVNLYRALCYQYTSETYSTQVADSAGHMLAKPYGVTIFNFYSKVDHSTSGGWTAACESCWSRGSFTAAGSGAIAAANLYLHISSHFETGTDGTAGRGGIISTTFSTTTLTNTLLWTTNSAGSMTAVTWDGAAFVTTQYSTVGTFLGQTSATTEGYTTYTTTTYISSLLCLYLKNTELE